jgi:AcrR family transcriptional regulator
MAATRRSSRSEQRRESGGLSRELIADKAAEIADREGLEALSMRRLASELGVGTMTLYGYFGSKDELLDHAIDLAASRIDYSPGEGEWRTRLRHLVATMWSALVEHPSAIQVRARRPILTAASLRAGEAGMAILREAGLGVDQAAAAWRLLFTYVFGYAAFSSEEPSPKQRAEWREQLRELPGGQFPNVSGHANELVNWMGGREPFEAGLELILDGIEAQLR